MATNQDLAMLLQSLQGLSQTGMQIGAQRQRRREFDQQSQMEQQRLELEKRQDNVKNAEAMLNLGKIPDPKMRVAAFNMIAGPLGFDPKNPVTAEFGKVLANPNNDVVSEILKAGVDFGLSQGQVSAFGQSMQNDPAGTLSAVMKTIEANQAKAGLEAQQQYHQGQLGLGVMQLGSQNADRATDNARQQAALEEERRWHNIQAAQTRAGGGLKPLSELGTWQDAQGNKAVWFADKQGNMTLKPLTEGMVAGGAPGAAPAPQAPDAQPGAAPSQATPAATPQATATPSAATPPGSVGGFAPTPKPLTEQQMKEAVNLPEAEQGNKALNAFLGSDTGKKWMKSGFWGQGTDIMLGQAPETAGKVVGALGAGIGTIAGGATGLRTGHPYQSAMLGAGAGTAVGAGIGEAMGSVLPQWASDAGKTYTSAVASVLAGFGFQQSGAATAVHEFERAKTALIPQPDDPDELIAEKARRRALMIEGMRKGISGSEMLNRLGIPPAEGGEAGPSAASPTAEATRPNVTQEEWTKLPKGGTYWYGGQMYTKE